MTVCLLIATLSLGGTFSLRGVVFAKDTKNFLKEFLVNFVTFVTFVVVAAVKARRC